MIRVTNSERGALACPQYWLLRYGLRLQSQRVGWALRVGTYWHELMDLVWVEGGAAARRKIQTDREAAQVALSRGFDPGCDAGLQAADQEALCDLVERMLRGYLATYGEKAALFWAGAGMGGASPETVWVEHVLEPQDMGPGAAHYTGKVDKLVRVNGALWIVEHKTTGRPLDEWWARNRNSPQPLTYAVCASRELGEPVRGVAYDVALTKPPATAGDFKLTQGGALSRRMPARATREALQLAIDAHGVEPQGWHADYLGQTDSEKALPALADMQAAAFRRELVVFDAYDLRRREAEMEVEAQQLQRWHDTLEPHLSKVTGTTESGSADWEQGVEDVLRSVGHKYPRNGTYCFHWNRACEMMTLCRTQRARGCVGLERRAVAHAELDDETTAQEGAT